MQQPDLEELQKKLDITDAAIQLYVAQDGVFNLHQVARKTEQTVEAIFDLFPDKESILHFFYTSLVIRYRLMTSEIEDFDSYTLSEKLSNFAYASFDMLKERQAFVEATFGPMILYSCTKTDYEDRIEQLLVHFFKNDSKAASSSSLFLNRYFFTFIKQKYLWLVAFWLKDNSPDKAKSMELTDKAAGLIQEMMYTSVIDRSIDLAKFAYANKPACTQLPLWDKITSTFEIR